MDNSQLMTEKQRRQVDKRISRFGIEAVKKYVERFFDKVDINCLTKQQAQKIITGMPMPNYIFGVYKRDYKS